MIIAWDSLGLDSEKGLRCARIVRAIDMTCTALNFPLKDVRVMKNM